MKFSIYQLVLVLVLAFCLSFGFTGTPVICGSETQIMASTEQQTPSTEQQTPSTEQQTPSTEQQTPSTEQQTPSTEQQTPKWSKKKITIITTVVAVISLLVLTPIVIKLAKATPQKKAFQSAANEEPPLPPDEKAPRRPKDEKAPAPAPARTKVDLPKLKAFSESPEVMKAIKETAVAQGITDPKVSIEKTGTFRTGMSALVRSRSELLSEEFKEQLEKQQGKKFKGLSKFLVSIKGGKMNSEKVDVKLYYYLGNIAKQNTNIGSQTFLFAHPRNRKDEGGGTIGQAVNSALYKLEYTKTK